MNLPASYYVLHAGIERALCETCGLISIADLVLQTEQLLTNEKSHGIYLVRSITFAQAES